MSPPLSHDPFEQAWQILAQAGLTGRVWVERPWLEDAVRAAGPVAIRLERALQQTEAIQQRIGQAAAAWDQRDREDAALIQRLDRALNPRWWRRRTAWNADQTRERLAILRGIQSQLTALDEALTRVSEGVDAALAHLETVRAGLPEADQPAWQALADRLRFARVGVAQRHQLVEGWRQLRTAEQRRWALLQVTAFPGPTPD